MRRRPRRSAQLPGQGDDVRMRVLVERSAQEADAIAELLSAEGHDVSVVALGNDVRQTVVDDHLNLDVRVRAQQLGELWFRGLSRMSRYSLPLEIHFPVVPPALQTRRLSF
jgi:hypothetical protein